MGWGWKFLGRSCKASKQQGSTCSLQDVQTRRREPNAKAQRQQQQQQQQQQQAQLSSVQFSSVQSGRPSLLTHKRRQQSFPITLLRCCCSKRRKFIILQLRKITGILYYLYMNIKFEKNAICKN
ncbi:hypothetical protein T4E_9487 [Trichinella pseudospiralis]|uniref:Uncharacterized protein n=1 Tax=Trichinella pseudospiralis TaxID=6337 RepID=A0A0V0YLW4_TRIPS|nr:hypothetical protein T4E_9487 [Trichinella pseudospiralis]